MLLLQYLSRRTWLCFNLIPNLVERFKSRLATYGSEVGLIEENDLVIYIASRGI